tara:strand:+ start:705 stop:2003 length:1299 start_codon:yes stop_codon:yes gene_type:complete
MSISKPVLDQEFTNLLKNLCKFEDNPDVAVSLSGGSDSMSLLYLTNNWIKQNGGTITALIFNHGIRDNSESECLKVKKWSNELGIKTHILNWNEKKPKSGLLQIARIKRYEIVLNECKKKNIMHLFVGHQLNDNAETYEMRIQREGNIIGLSSIPPLTNLNSVRIIRPFLNVNKKRLEETCKFYSQDWVTDPSNNCDKYERVRVRKHLSKKNNEYLLNIKTEIKKNIKKRKKIEILISNFFAKNLYFYNYGIFEFKKKVFFANEHEVQIEIIKRILTSCSGKTYPPKKKSVESLILIAQENEVRIQTLHSSIIKSCLDKFKIYRESFKTLVNTKNGLFIKKNSTGIWDYRFKVFCKSNDIFCYNINSSNWSKIKKKILKVKKNFVDFEIIKTLPLIKVNGTFLVPFINSKLMDYYQINFFYNPKIQLTNNKF